MYQLWLVCLKAVGLLAILELEDSQKPTPFLVKENNNHNLSYLKAKRKHLRNNGTSAEATLWKFLQKSQLNGRKFRRQHSVANYILDFYCAAEKLAIELDGDHHFTSAGWAQDQKRDDYLKTEGITVLRFESNEVFDALPAVLERIAEQFENI